MGRPTKEESAAYKRIKSYYNTFCTEAGKTVLKDLKKMFDVQSYIPGDPYATAFNEGRRSVLNEIMSTLRLSKHPELFESEDVLDEIQNE